MISRASATQAVLGEAGAEPPVAEEEEARANREMERTATPRHEAGKRSRRLTATVALFKVARGSKRRDRLRPC
jgi:hypothetical protein